MFYALFFIIYRGIANSKFIPYILGKESKAEFLQKELNFKYGDFYDIDGYFQKNQANFKNVLLIGFHNLYYVNFPFTDQSYVKRGDVFSHIAVQNAELPERFADFKLIYTNPVTNVKLYTKDKLWVY